MSVLLAVALATHLLVARDGDATILLSDEQGVCPMEWHRAVYASPEGEVPGCWHEERKIVWIKWDDGDRSVVAREMFHEARDS